ncbi:hypothetical protein BKA64DRAFT_721754 [Cadophora sp. MPI-SDFR-AT-0126]|nr:hypothetical protein BKA64DRAFT_721754 [Leotiomycetes sp. MPI-SDFR-AT-0126]
MATADLHRNRPSTRRSPPPSWTYTYPYTYMPPWLRKGEKKKNYRPRQGGPPRRAQKTVMVTEHLVGPQGCGFYPVGRVIPACRLDLNLGRRDFSKRSSQQETDMMSHLYSPSYNMTGRDAQTIIRGIEAIENMTDALNTQQTWLAQALESWNDAKKEEQAIKHRELDLEEKKFERNSKDNEAYHHRFLLGAFVVLFVAWIFGAWLRVFGQAHHASHSHT